MAFAQWAEIVRRLWLFDHEYNRELYVNHIGEEVFPLIHTVNALLVFSGLIAMWVLRRVQDSSRWLIAAAIAANAAAWLTIIAMRATGVLVGYNEFIRHWQTGG